MRGMSKKRGQVTVFIIVGILIVAAILIFVLWVRPTYISQKGQRLGFEGCVSDAVEKGIEDLGRTAGALSPEFTYEYRGEDFTYLCYTNEYYKTCTIQRPFLKQFFESQLKTKVKENIQVCYETSLDELKAQGYGVTSGDVTYDIDLEPGTVLVEIDAPTTVGSQNFRKFNIPIDSPIYEMTMLATSIVQAETHYGDFETSKTTILYPDYIIDKLKQGDGTTLYIIESKLFKNKFQFASRSLVLPPGNILA